MNDPWMDELDPELRQQLQHLKEVPERDPDLAARGKADYMAMVRRLAVEQRATARSRQQAAVSETPFVRLKEWIGSIGFLYPRKERFSMVSILATIAIVLGLVFGGAGATVYAAQDSMPGEALYQLKLFTEDVRQELTADPQAEFKWTLELAYRRTKEIGSLLQDGELIPQQVADRLQHHMHKAFELTSDMDDAEQLVALLTLQRVIRDQDQVMGQGRNNAPTFIDPVMAQIQNQHQFQRQLIETALETPHQFRERFKQGLQEPETEPVEELGTEPVLEEPAVSTTQEAGFGPGPNDQPGVEPPFGPNTTDDPGTNNGYSPNGYPECELTDLECQQYYRYQYPEPVGPGTPSGNGKKP